MNKIDVMVETPKGSKYKYKFDPETDRLKVNKLLTMGVAFPYDFGFIPGTAAEDGDPLDVLIISEDSFLPGSIVECSFIGAIKATQTSGNKTVRNDRIMAIPALLENNTKSAFGNLKDRRLKELEEFFVYYNKMQKKEFKALGTLDAEETWKLVEKAGLEEHKKSL